MSEQATERVQVGASAVVAPPAVELAVASPISKELQQVQDERGNSTALRPATNSAQIAGQDVVGAALPLRLTGVDVPSGSETWGRLIRLEGFAGNFYDIGIDAEGQLFINDRNSSKNEHVVVIDSKTGTVTLSAKFIVLKGEVEVPNIKPATSAPDQKRLEAVQVDPETGALYYL